MDAQRALHPSKQTLRLYAVGKLDDIAAAAVIEHIEECPDCRRAVEEIAPDTFLRAAREIHAALGYSTDARFDPDETRSRVGVGGPKPPSASTLPPGLRNHPDYEILRELGRGGMGVVYLARNRLMGRDEVLKVIRRQITERPGVLDRFQREIRSVAQLQHPNIVTAYTAFHLDGGLAFAMEYVEGLDLSRLVKVNGPLPVLHACYFAHQTALGLQHAYERGTVHRDIKPQNLMLTHDRKRRVVKILDFGLAKVSREEKLDSGLTSEGQALGTPDYIAPEQIIRASSADIRADIYSLGGTLYYLLTGHPPFQADALYDLYQAHMSQNADPLNLVRPEVPTELAALVAKMMAKDPGRRFQTPIDVAQALKPFCRKGAMAFRAGVVDGLVETIPLGGEVGAVAHASRGSRPELYDHAPLVLDGESSSIASVARAGRKLLPERLAPPSASASKKLEHGSRSAPFKGPRAIVAAAIAAVCVLFSIAFGWWYVATVKGLDVTGDVAGERWATKMTLLAESSNLAKAGGKTAAPTRPPLMSDQAKSSRTIAPNTSEINEMVVGISSARLGPPDEGNGADVLTLGLRITNRSMNPMKYVGWSDPKIRVTVRDMYGNWFNRISRDSSGKEVSIPPGETIIDRLVLERTSFNSELNVDLPLPGTDKTFEFTILPLFIERTRAPVVVRANGIATTSPPKTAASNSAASPPGARSKTEPYEPENDPKVRERIRTGYISRMAEINQRRLGYSSNAAAVYKRRESAKLLKKLAEDNDLTEDQVQRILRSNYR
jgi:hypothetical protein